MGIFDQEVELTDRPECVRMEHLVFLDELRESGVTNMFGAAPYLMQAFDMPRNDAVTTLSYWMRTFKSRHAL